MRVELDDVDRAILSALSEDARNNTNAEISERIGVSASTVGNRISRLQENDVVRGYRLDVDYARAGFTFQVLFVCTAPIAERHALVEEVLGIDGVVNVREMMTGTRNVHVQVVGSTNDDVTRIARTIDDLGLVVNEEILVRAEHARPSAVFGASESGGL